MSVSLLTNIHAKYSYPNLAAEQTEKLCQLINQYSKTVTYMPPVEDMSQPIRPLAAIMRQQTLLSQSNHPSLPFLQSCLRFNHKRIITKQRLDQQINTQLSTPGIDCLSKEQTTYIKSDSHQHNLVNHLKLYADQSIVELEMVDKTTGNFSHLSQAFMPLTASHAIVYKPAFTENSQKRLAHDFQLLEASHEACLQGLFSSLWIDPVLIMPASCESMALMLEQNGFKPVGIREPSYFVGQNPLNHWFINLD
jgi:N-dimethylarginine dimethylaminohydrolase